MRASQRVQEIWRKGVAAVDGYHATMEAVQSIEQPDQILAVGKAAGAMARAAVEHFETVPTLVVTKDGHGDGLPAHIAVIGSLSSRPRCPQPCGRASVARSR